MTPSQKEESVIENRFSLIEVPKGLTRIGKGVLSQLFLTEVPVRKGFIRLYDGKKLVFKIRIQKGLGASLDFMYFNNLNVRTIVKLKLSGKFFLPTAKL